MSPSTRELLLHILDETTYLIESVQLHNVREFLADPTLKRAFARSVEVIGEAVKFLPADLKEQHPGIDWKAIAGMRDRLIHHYFGVDYEIVWDVAVSKIPELDGVIRAMLVRWDGG
jgi:uncharacterized protein with HEPN domain